MRRKKKTGNFYLFLMIIIILFFVVSNYIKNNKTVKNNSIKSNSVFKINKEDELVVNYIDVGQGDSAFIELPNNESILIDSGEKSEKDKVIEYIKKLGYEKIDYVVGTHPHTDHIGGLSFIIEEFNIGNIYMPKKASNSDTFINLLATIKNKKLKVTSAKSGVVIKDDNDLKIKIIAPVKEYSDANNSSAVIKLNYKNVCFLFMGDAEVNSENDITDDVSCDVVKIGHHGSDSSSSINFVKRTKAKYAVISVGENNIYNHPYENIINRWKDNGAKVLRTDKLGDIVIKTDGKNIVVDKKEEEINKKSNIELISANVKRNEVANIKIKGEKNTKYEIEVYTASGKSKAKGLEPKLTDDLGYVEWNYKVSSNAKTGTYRIVIKSKDEMKEFDYEIK